MLVFPELKRRSNKKKAYYLSDAYIVNSMERRR
jgi:hypothetical protein